MIFSLIWPIDGNLKYNTTLDQSGPWSSDNEELLHRSKNSSTGALPAGAVLCLLPVNPLFFQVGRTSLSAGYTFSVF